MTPEMMKGGMSAASNDVLGSRRIDGVTPPKGMNPDVKATAWVRKEIIPTKIDDFIFPILPVCQVMPASRELSGEASCHVNCQTDDGCDTTK
jgi:hypothetical protein